MKKFVMVLIVLLFAFNVNSFEAITSFGTGFVLQSGSNATLGHSFTVKSNVVTLAKRGFTLVTEASYLQADRSYGDASGELQVLRTFSTNVKTLGFWNLSTGLGGGFWNIFNTEGEDAILGATKLELTWMKNDIVVTLGSDVVFVPGEYDLYYPNLSLSYVF